MKPVCLVVGVGPGNGLAISKRFREAGYRVAMLARSEAFLTEAAASHPDLHAFTCDAASPDELDSVCRRVEAQLGPIETVVYNAGKGVWGTFTEVPLQAFEEAWRVNVLGALAVARAVAPGMRARGVGRIVFVGATASRRGGKQTPAFASAKAAQRSLAESLARDLGPSGIHVSLVVIDGIVDEPIMRAKLAHRPDEFFIRSVDIAETILVLASQPRSAWTFELEVRPFAEVW